MTLRTAETVNSTLIRLEELLVASQAPTHVLGDAEDWIESTIPPDDVPGLTMSAEEWVTLEEESKGQSNYRTDVLSPTRTWHQNSGGQRLTVTRARVGEIRSIRVKF
jgi:hypothetical protein